MEHVTSENFESAKGQYTLEDLEKAREGLESWQERFANDSSNNPNKYQSQIKDAITRVRLIEGALKTSGLLEKTEQEKLTEELDELYPDAKSRKIVTYQGKRYQIRYFPLDQSRSGKTVREWGHDWRLLKE